jgi:predicted O-methyltransferase YrrM
MDTIDYIYNRFNVPKHRRGRRFIQIRDFGRNDLAQVFSELGFTKGVEIGTEKGKYALQLMKANPNLHLTTCDPYYIYENAEGYLVSEDENFHKKHYKQAKKRLEQYPNCQIVTLPSMATIEPFDRNSIDFVYIDGNHRLDYVTEDIVNWTYRVKPGGIVALHDYIKHKGQKFSHVPYAIHAYMEAYLVPQLFILDQKNKAKRTEEEDRHYDRIRTCFFIKQ